MPQKAFKNYCKRLFSPAQTVVTVPHPRDGFFGYFDQYDLDPFQLTLDDSLLQFLNPLVKSGLFSSDFDAIEKIKIYTSHHTHYVIGTGANDPQKMDPKASRETLDHSIPYIFTVALQDGAWHHVDSYTPERAGRADTVELWNKVTTLEDVLETADIFITATGNFDIITVDHMAKMKDKAIVGNIGHFDNEIDMAGLAKVSGIVRETIKPQVDKWIFPDGRCIIVLSEGRLLNLGNATGHPSFVMSNSFTNQVMAQMELWAHHDNYAKDVFVLPKHLDEKVARLHLDALGVKLTELTKPQADYLGVAVEGPYKPDHYRY